MTTKVFLLLLLLTTCNGQKKAAADSTQDTKEEGSQEFHDQDEDVFNSNDRLTLVASDSYGGTEQPETLIIKDAKSLQKFYSKINRTRKPGLPVPDIDFSKEMVVVRCSGTTDEGAMPEVYIMGETEDEFLLGTRKTDGIPNSSAITTPFSVYRMALTEKEVVVRERPPSRP